MPRIIIKSVADLKKLNKKLRTLKSTLPTLQKFALEKAADETVLTAIHRDMETNNFSKKIIDNTFVGPIEISEQGKNVKVHFISDYVSDDGFDVSNAREEGTRDHDVFPLKPDGWLTYIDPNTGKRVFRKHTHPSGIERLLIIETNINSNRQRFTEAYKKEISAQINQVVSV